MLGGGEGKLLLLMLSNKHKDMRGYTQLFSPENGIRK